MNKALFNQSHFIRAIENLLFLLFFVMSFAFLLGFFEFSIKPYQTPKLPHKSEIEPKIEALANDELLSDSELIDRQNAVFAAIGLDVDGCSLHTNPEQCRRETIQAIQEIYQLGEAK